MEPVSNNTTRCIPLWCHHRSTRNETETKIKQIVLKFGKGEVLSWNVLHMIGYFSMMYGQAQVLRPGLSKNVFSPSSPFIHTYPTPPPCDVQSFGKKKKSYDHNSIYISDPCSICGCFFSSLCLSFPLPHPPTPPTSRCLFRHRHRFIVHPPAHLNISPLLPRFPSLPEHMRHTPESFGQPRIRAERAT